jgi:DNA-binding response OmpR family regulator
MNVTGKTVLLAGIDPMLAQDLHLYLTSRGFDVHECSCLEPENKKSPNGNYFDLVFCETHHPGLHRLLQAVSSPVVVVSRVPEVNDWLDAMDAGAADYCAAPFEREQLDWILESNLRQQKPAVAAA